ncbi:MAG: M48 family metalloprotease [Burkholderiaceae bacterium]|nr:M48 family metalloprotease [Burkholderiaceae bacterium]
MLRSKTGDIVWKAQTVQIKSIHEIKERIEQAARIRARLLISHDKEPNAYAGRMNGWLSIGLTSGMIDLLGNDRDAYAAVLGHEFAHLHLNHSKAREERRVPMQAASLILGTALSIAGVPLGGTIADVGTTMIETSYSRDEERDADAKGLEYVIQAGFDPHGAVRLWERMQTQASGFSLPFLSTHPMSQERAQTMREIVAAFPVLTEPTGAQAATAAKADALEAPNLDATLVSVGKTVYVVREPMSILRQPQTNAEPIERIYMHSGLIVEEVRHNWIRVQSTANSVGWIPMSPVRIVID